MERGKVDKRRISQFIKDEEIRKELINYLKKFGCSLDNAEDICQNAFEKLWKTAKSNDKVVYKAFIYKTVMRSLYDHYPKLPPDKVAAKNIEKVQAKNKDPSGEVIKTELIDLLQRIVLELPTKFRKPVILRIYQSMTFPQMAAHLKLKECTVKDHFYSAMEQLEQRLRSLGLENIIQDMID